MKICIGLLLLLGAGAHSAARGQESQAPSTGGQLAGFRMELHQLRHQLDSLLRAGAGELPAGAAGAADSGQSEELDAMETRFEERIQELENKIDAVSRASAPVVLNPRTIAFINFAARADNTTQLDATGEHEISNRPFLRSAELELRNPVDPYAEAVLIMTLESEAGKDFAVDAEEAYGLIKRLPILEEAPLGMKLKIGKFRAPLGQNNRIHMHDLPWTTRPLVVSRFMGTEHGDFFEAGFNVTGADADFFLPDPLPQTTLEMNVDLVRAGELGLSLGRSGSQPAYIGHLTLSRDWNNEHLLLLGASTYQESGPPAASRLYGADLTYKWSPAEQRESKSIVAGGEFYTARRTFADSSTGGREVRMTPYGWFGYLQYQTSYWLYLGARYDWVREPSDDRLLTRGVAAYASYYTTEFLRFRLGFEHRMSDIPALNNTNTAVFEVNFVYGSHPTEPYWVNR